MSDASVVESCASPNALLQGNVAETVHPNAGGRGVGNTHLADAYHVASLAVAVIHQTDAYFQRTVELIVVHGSLIAEVACTSGYLLMDDARHAAQVVVDTHINDVQLESMLTAEHVDAATTMCEVHHLLPRYLTRRHADTFALNAMIAAKQQVAWVRELRRQRLLDKAELHSQFLQTP